MRRDLFQILSFFLFFVVPFNMDFHFGSVIYGYTVSSLGARLVVYFY